MSLALKKTVAVFQGEVAIEEAETLLQWLTETPKPSVNLRDLEHAHTAVLQVLMAVKPKVSRWPDNPALGQTLKTLLA